MLRVIEEWNTSDDGYGTDMITLECDVCGATFVAPSGSDPSCDSCIANEHIEEETIEHQAEGIEEDGKGFYNDGDYEQFDAYGGYDMGDRE
jgi:hypothetical protein